MKNALGRASVRTFVALGANLGDPVAAIHQAFKELQSWESVCVVRCSSLYRTAPMDSTGPDYVNAVVELHTVLTAPALLVGLQSIEDKAGRERPYRNAPRVLDLDLLTYGQARIYSEQLQVPHPRMRERAFVLIPLAEISPEQVTAADLLTVKDQVITRLAV